MKLPHWKSQTKRLLLSTALLAALAIAPPFSSTVSAQEEAPSQELTEELLPESEEGEEGEEVSPIWRWTNFGILAVLLGIVLVKNLPTAFKSRTDEIQFEINEAQKQKTAAEKRAADMDARLRALGADIEKFKVEASAEMGREGERIRNETVAQIARVEQQATVEIDSAGKAATRQIKQYAADLALKMAEERIRSRMDHDAASGQVDRFIADLERRGTNN